MRRFLILLLLAFPLRAFANHEPGMRAELVSGEIDGKPARWIAAEGDITWDTLDSFRAIASSEGTRLAGLTVYLSSDGGSASAGLEIARFIRFHKLNTGLGRTLKRGARGTSSVPIVTFELANCSSACVFAFTGGVERSHRRGGSFFVHQFGIYDDEAGSEQKQYTPSEHGTVQRLSAEAHMLLLDMGVDPILMLYVNSAPYDGRLFRLPHGLVHQLKLATIDRSDPPSAGPDWYFDKQSKLAAVSGRLPLRAGQEASYELWIRCWPDDSEPTLTLKLRAIGGVFEDPALSVEYAELETQDKRIRINFSSERLQYGPVAILWVYSSFKPVFTEALSKSRRLILRIVYRPPFGNWGDVDEIDLWEDKALRMIESGTECASPKPAKPAKNNSATTSLWNGVFSFMRD
jgi:hypothetical protein